MAKNLIAGTTTTIIESGSDISVDLNTNYKDFIDIDESLQTTANTLSSAINENNGRLNNLVYTEVVTLASNINVPANNSPATQTYQLTPKPGYTPILATLANTYNGVINLWYVSLDHSNNKINWRIHNVSSSQASSITVRVEVLYIKSDSYLGAF